MMNLLRLLLLIPLALPVQAQIQVVDAAGRTVTLEQPASRIPA